METTTRNRIHSLRKTAKQLEQSPRPYAQEEARQCRVEADNLERFNQPAMESTTTTTHRFVIDPAYRGTSRDYCSECGKLAYEHAAPPTEAQATARPWEYSVGNDGACIYTDGGTIATLTDEMLNHSVDAALIVKAVNSHDALVEALRAILDDLQLHAEELPPIPAVCELWAQGKTALDAALRLAGAQSL